ncbi:16S rRNA (cytidine(1402)-2'-O)-methyltransferase [SAR86 cluster bacterium]|nr:16S rRNA (cytidine(1402)-2'-O)-methyltransferase [SAR86 cluster bacterium]
MSTLYLVSTPIGNKLDISLRAQNVLSSVDVILCEDTKKSGIFLKDLGIKNKLLSYHDHSNVSKINYFLKLLKEGASLAIISDAGTPLISDPGYELVAKAIDEKIKVTSIPGPSAIISALISSGLSTSSFVFEGYAPKKKGQLETFLKNLQYEMKTIILFESPKRIERLVQMIVKILGPKRKVSLAKELTKKFERVITDEAKEIHELIIKDETLKKGEMVVVIEGSKEKQLISVEHEKVLFEEIQKLNGTKAASKIVSKISSKTSKEIYSIFSESKNDK